VVRGQVSGVSFFVLLETVARFQTAPLLIPDP
jgi:hypothetical protein